MFLLTTLSIGYGIAFIAFLPATTQAMGLYNPDNPFWDRTHWITLQQNVRVVKVHNKVPMSKSYVVGSYIANKGAHYKLFRGINDAWGLVSGRFRTNKQSTYRVVKPARDHSWFEFGIH